MLLTDEQGNAGEGKWYPPFGDSLYDIVPTDRGYTGQRFDDEANLYYYGARWYDPALGQFTQPDSLVPDPLRPIAWNRYAYAYNSPLVYTDPSGHIALPAGLLLVAATGFLVGEIYAGSQGYTPLDAEFWHYSLGAAALATSGYLLAADLALVAGYGLQGAGLWASSPALFGMGMGLGGMGAGMYAWAFQPLDFRRLPPGVSAAKPADAPAIRAFGRKAEVVQKERGFKSFGSDWWDYFAGRIEAGATEGWFVHRSGEEITGMMRIVPQTGIMEVRWIEGLGGGAGTRLMQEAVMRSMVKGYGGALYLHAGQQAVDAGIYHKLGPSLFDPAQENLFMWDVSAALSLLFR